jgi:L-alanine-DL-glutamate epimerase-like enolase superfamily enzyme
LFENFVLNKRISDGCIEIPNKPGLGLELNEELIEKHKVKQGQKIF